MEISIVINCSDDFHLFKTIESIDEDVEIICSITPNKKIESKLTEMKIPYAITPKGNQSVTTNAGIKFVTNDKFILMDSDCYFENGFIRNIFKLLDNHMVINGNIIFDYNNNLLSKTISKCKKFDDIYDCLAHKPGLGLRKNLLQYIGNYWFDESLPWAEDSELSYRITKAGINILHDNNFSIHHSPTPYKHNLKSCFFYGGGDYIRFSLLNQSYELSFITYELNRYKNLLKKFNVFELLVMITNDCSYQFGYFLCFFKTFFHKYLK